MSHLGRQSNCTNSWFRSTYMLYLIKGNPAKSCRMMICSQIIKEMSRYYYIYQRRIIFGL